MSETDWGAFQRWWIDTYCQDGAYRKMDDVAWAAWQAGASASSSPAPAAEPVPDALAVLRELVALQDLQDEVHTIEFIGPGGTHGEAWEAVAKEKRRDYIRRAGPAWAAARAVLAAPSPQPAPTVPADRAGLVEECKRLREGLRFYAGAGHFHGDPDDLDEFDSVSGEPESWLFHCDNSMMIENGGVARLYLRGKRANWVDGDDDDTPTPIEGEVSVLDRLASSAAQVPEGGGFEFVHPLCDQKTAISADGTRTVSCGSGEMMAELRRLKIARAVDPVSGQPIVTDADLLAVCAYMTGIGMRSKQVHDGPVTYFISVEHVEEGAL